MAAEATTISAGLNVASSAGNIIATPFNIMNQVNAAKIEASNMAASAAALSAERENVLRKFDRETRELAANQTVAYIMSGLESTGTVTSTQQTTAAERAADKWAIWRNYQTNIDNARRAEKAAQKSGRNAFIGGVAQMAGTAAAVAVFSDERLKENLICVGKSRNGLNIYLGRYTKESGLDDGNTHLFLIAQEVQKIRPQAIKKHENGFLMVDYAMALL